MKGKHSMSTEKNTFNDPRFLAFLRAVRTILAEETGEVAITRKVAEAVRELLSAPLVLPDAYRAPRDDHYVMYPLYVADDSSFSVASAVWNVGQQTPVHDHGVWGVVGIVEGIEREIRYVKPVSGAGGALTELPNEDFSPGEVTICCTSDADIHAVSCASAIPCVGLHVYGGDIGTIRRRTYRPEDGEIGYFTSSWPEIVPAVVEV